MSQKNKIYFNNAPIKEAVCTFQFAEKIEPDEIEAITDSLKTSYVSKEIQTLVSIQIDPKSPSPKILNSDKTILKNSIGNEIVDIHSNSISIHKLGRYTKWSDFSKQIIHVLKKSSGVKINSIFLKKINSFTIDNNEKISDYFNYVSETFPSYFLEREMNNFNLSKRLKKHSTLFLKFSQKLLNEESQNIIIELSVNINLSTENITTNAIDEIEESLLYYNNEIYNAFISILKEKAISQIK